jgi:membrane associated rhomboid family serine protease
MERSMKVKAHQRSPKSGNPMVQPGAPMFLWTLVGIMAAIELVLNLSASNLFGSIDQRETAFLLGAFWQPVLSGAVQPVYPGQTVLMFITYAFLHGGILHLVMNSAILLSLGKFISIQIGAYKTLFVLCLSAIAGAACFGLLSTGNRPMIGASGAVFGLIGMWQAMEYHARKKVGLSVQPVIIGLLGLIIANILIFAMLSGGLAWETHLGGWLAGWLTGLCCTRRFSV